MENQTTQTAQRSAPRRRISGISARSLLGALFALSLAVCARSPKPASISASQPASRTTVAAPRPAPRSAFARVERCPEAPVEEPVCTGSGE